ncbi:MAG: hypothetical protein GY722_07000 [bacterium]|nr:hypothetical protein [bacterium]
MADEIDISSIERNARRAGYGDGLLELFAAAVLSVIALAWAANPGFVGIAAALIVLYGWKAVERVKERVTYPRIGYFQERADESNTSVRGMFLFIGGAFLVMALVVLLSGSLSEAADWRRAAPLMSGITLAAGFWYAGEQSGFLRHRFIAAFSVVSGILLWLFGSGETYAAVVWHLVGLAVPLVILGVWGLNHFLRSHPRRSIDG